MKILKKIVSFFKALFSHEREEGSPYKKVAYIADQLKIVVDTIENYKLTYATISIDISSQEDIERIKKELDNRKNLTYSIDEDNKIIKFYYHK